MKFVGINIGLKTFSVFLAIFSLITQTHVRQPVKLFLVIIAIISLVSILIDGINLRNSDSK